MENQLLFGWSWLRSSVFTAEALLLPMAEFLATGRRPQLPFDDLDFLRKVQASHRKLLREDAERISRGVYPASVLLHPHPVKESIAHLKRIPVLFREAMELSKRRAGKKTKAFDSSLRGRLQDLPAYYQRNFHFQRDGYLSDESAELYEHQVEVLFTGAADAMRRLLLEPLKTHFQNSSGKGLRFLEIGCGTGSATRFVRAAFPEAEIVALDLSEAYVHLAERRFGREGVKFQVGAGEDLAFSDQTFDAVYSVFLFHELPHDVRLNILRESHRVLKESGVFAFVDSLQLGDTPDLDQSLKQFPIRFHEPFYRNYIKTPMTELLHEAGFHLQAEGTGFFSKWQSAVPVKTPRRQKKLAAARSSAQNRPSKRGLK